MSADAGLDFATAPTRIGIVQLCSRNNKEANFAACRRHIADAAAAGCRLVALPENFSFMGARPGESQEAAEPLSGTTLQLYRALAREHGVWLSLGGFQETSEDPAFGENGLRKIFNTHVIVNADGEIVKSYRKIHLFDAPFTGLVESKQTNPGSDVVWCDSPVGRLGVTICYDVRFPELYQRLRFEHGCDILLVPSAFTMETGEAHWETVLRARAIECQCFIIAAAQAGRHNEDGNKRTSWGHSLVVDPWGKVLADLGGEEACMRVIELDHEVLDRTRKRMPLVTQRRYDLYGGPYVRGGLDDAELRRRARHFVELKNAAGRGANTLEPVFEMCAPNANIYGLTGEKLRSGLTAFFAEHQGLQHEFLAEPETVGPSAVQYAFVKSWTSGDEVHRWLSIDPAKPRNKVERLEFDSQGRLARVSVVDAIAPVAPSS